MKVLTFISSLSLNSGGPSRSVPMLVKGLVEVGINITLMTYWSDDMNIHALDGTNARLKIIKKNFNSKDMEEFIISEKFDIIQLQSIWDLKYHLVVNIARKHNIPYIITPRGMLEPWSLCQSKLKKKLALSLYQMKDLKCAACIFTTAEMEAQHVRELGINVPMSVIPNGIETEAYKCRSSMEEIKKQILFLSRVHEKKGIELLIYAFHSIVSNSKVSNIDEWKLIIVGNGQKDYIRNLELKVKSLKMESYIKILPPVFGEAKVKLYQESSIFCLPSYSENFGMVIAEAMSCGVPCITTNGTPWKLLNGEVSTMGVDLSVLFNDRKTGWCIDLSVENLEKALREAMIMEPTALYKMGQRGSKLITKNFNYCIIAKRTKQLYLWINGGMNNVDKPSFVYL